ncbi:MAG: nitrogenase, partial [Candidatus Electrothrix sp. LOE1_4_5]|nr:nitrogenase [Candidatus Electrothrix gigas]
VVDFGLHCTMLPDLSETMDRPVLLEYEKVAKGGTPLLAVEKMGCSQASIEFGRTLSHEESSSLTLQKKFHVAHHRLGMPVGIEETDRFFELLSTLSGRPIPEKYSKERGRLVDAYVDGHKYVFGKKAIVYGEEDLVVGMTAFLAEIGIFPILCASGGTSGRLAEAIAAVTGDMLAEQPAIHEGVDFFDIAEIAESLQPDLLIGHSKGYPLARKLNIPLIRVGFPIHDRVGGQRILHLGYSGAQQLFDQVANALIAKKQADSEVGYSYM